MLSQRLNAIVTYVLIFQLLLFRSLIMMKHESKQLKSINCASTNLYIK